MKKENRVYKERDAYEKIYIFYHKYLNDFKDMKKYFNIVDKKFYSQTIEHIRSVMKRTRENLVSAESHIREMESKSLNKGLKQMADKKAKPAVKKPATKKPAKAVKKPVAKKK